VARKVGEEKWVQAFGGKTLREIPGHTREDNIKIILKESGGMSWIILIWLSIKIIGGLL